MSRTRLPMAVAAILGLSLFATACGVTVEGRPRAVSAPIPDALQPDASTTTTLPSLDAEQVEIFLGGAEVGDVRVAELAEVVGGLRLIPTSERPAEGQRAEIHRSGLGAAMHSEAYMSFAVRAIELSDLLDFSAVSRVWLTFFIYLLL